MSSIFLSRPDDDDDAEKQRASRGDAARRIGNKGPRGGHFFVQSNETYPRRQQPL
jgi:hypothetical protein